MAHHTLAKHTRSVGHPRQQISSGMETHGPDNKGSLFSATNPHSTNAPLCGSQYPTRSSNPRTAYPGRSETAARRHLLHFSVTAQLLSTILPEIFPYEQEKQCLADAALLPHEQLNFYASTIIYNHLTTSQEITAWLLSLLRVYLVHIRPKAMNPDHQPDQKQRQHISTILDILVKHDQQLLEDIYPSISFWHHVNIFFQQQRSHFDAYTLKDINNRINQSQLPKTTYAELRQELFSFLANRISTETDLGRVIDHLQDALTPELSGYAPKTMAMYKEMTRLVGESTKKQDTNIAKIVVYIKVTLNEAISLRNLKIPSQRIDQFVNECLTNLLSPLNERQIRDILPTPYQWHESIVKLWEQYLHVYKTQHPLAKSSRLSLPPSRGEGRPSAQPTLQPDPRVTLKLPIPPMPSRPETASIMNNPTPSSPSLQGQGQFVLPTHNPTQNNPRVQPTNTPVPHHLAGKFTRLQQALDSRQVDRIAAAYDEQLDPWLNPNERRRVRIAQDIMTAYTKGKKTTDFRAFVTLYSEHQKNFGWSKEIESTIDNLRLRTLQEEISSRKIEEIVKCYKDRFQLHLSREDRQLSNIAVDIFNAHNKSKLSNDYRYFIIAYNKYLLDFILTNKLILSSEMQATIDHLKEQSRGKL
jgi:hypothetical protein